MTMFYPYENNSSYPKTRAQSALNGRTFYVDDKTLRFHKSRISDSGISHNGLLFWLIESVALDMENTKRGFRFVVFDVTGRTIYRQNLIDTFKTKKQAKKALDELLADIDVMSETKEGIESERRCLDQAEKEALKAFNQLNKGAA